LPDRERLREALVLELFGSPDPLQVDGIGGSKSHTSKVMAVTDSDADGVDVEYTFGQVAVDDPVVDWSGNCGNLTSAVGVFAVLDGLVEPTAPAVELTLRNTNTGTLIDQRIPTADGEPDVYGDYAVDGVPGTGACISSRFRDPAGSVTGSLFPTGAPVDRVTVDEQTVECSVVDVGNPCVFVRAADLGLSGTELPGELTETEGLLDRTERIRGAVCQRLGLAERAETAGTESPAVPQFAVVSPSQSYDCSVDKRVEADDIDVTGRIVTSGTSHHAYAVTGAMCLPAATRLPGTVPNGVRRDGVDESVTIGHPKGTIRIGVDIESAGETRT
jgi:2-methylaconitate cis-trans-isomerase PrpF